MKDFNTLPDAKSIEKFLAKHNLDGYETIQLIDETPKDIILFLDYGDDETTRLVIRRRKGDNDNYRISCMS